MITHRSRWQIVVAGELTANKLSIWEHASTSQSPSLPWQWPVGKLDDRWSLAGHIVYSGDDILIQLINNHITVSVLTPTHTVQYRHVISYSHVTHSCLI